MNYTRKRNLVLLLRHFLVNISTTNIEKVVSMLFAQHRWTTFPFQPNINVETTLGHQHWIDIILSMLFQRCFANVETTLINVSRLNFHFQPNISVETTLMTVDYQRCFNVDVFGHYCMSNRIYWIMICHWMISTLNL